MNFIKKFLRDIFCDRKDGRVTFSLGRGMLIALFCLAFYNWAWLSIDILPNMFAIFSSLVIYVLGSKAVSQWSRVNVKQEVNVSSNFEELGD
tara:strand:- start:267 stop:542 length:276 start_codon:yes stop_codon:yes gene_type:complete